jgi:2,4-dienoyl-CoA reductase (NADPH2)
VSPKGQKEKMKVFEPCYIGNVAIKNRLVMSPMTTNFSQDGFVTDEMMAYFEERAKGGVGLITVEPGVVEYPRGNHLHTNLALDDDKYIPGLKKLTSVVHSHGAKISIQISHGGARAGKISKTTGRMEITRGVLPVGPSVLAHPVPGQVVPKELSVEEIGDLVEKFRKASIRILESGFDAMELHCAHMYLLGEFISPWANKRKDQYGGSLEGRLRFILEIIKGIKESVGEQVPIVCRFNGMEPEGGNTLQEIQEIARKLEQAKVNALHISAGFGAPIKDPSFIPSSAPGRVAENCIVHLAANIKNVVSIPIITVNRIKDVMAAEKILQAGYADLIAMGRPLIADPYLPLKSMEGRLDDIRPCIYCCQGCAQNAIEMDAPIACNTNPMVGKEKEGPPKAARRKKKVFIIGAGPGGMQAALTAAARGHDVVLTDKADEMGGQLPIASKPPGKQEIDRFTKYLKNQVLKSKVRVELGKEITPKRLAKVEADAIILATGSRPIIPKIEGLQETKTFLAKGILAGVEIPGKKIVVIGGGQVGAEVGEFLSEKGKEVTIIEILADIAPDMPSLQRLPLIMALESNKVRILTQTKVTSVNDKGVWIERRGETHLIPAEGIVIAVGGEPCADNLDQGLTAKGRKIHKIGDRKKPRSILEAVREGYEVANKI